MRRHRRLLATRSSTDPSALSQKAPTARGGGINFTLAPMMHGAGEVTVIRSVIHGDTVVLTPKFDAEQTWRVIEAEKVNVLGITGDAMARPLADKLEEIHDDVDLSSLFSIGSSAAIFSQSIKDQLMERLPNIVVVDSVGATETGMNGIKIAQRARSSTAARPRCSRRSTRSSSTTTSTDRAGLGRDRPPRAHRQHPARLLQRPGAQRARRSSSTTASATRSPATSRRSRRTVRSRCSVAARS